MRGAREEEEEEEGEGGSTAGEDGEDGGGGGAVSPAHARHRGTLEAHDRRTAAAAAAAGGGGDGRRPGNAAGKGAVPGGDLAAAVRAFQHEECVQGLHQRRHLVTLLSLS